MELKGTIVQNLGLEKGIGKTSGKEWQKAAIVVETDGAYPRRIYLTNFKDADKFAALQVFTKGVFHIEVESREWKNPKTGKSSWFTEVNCWKWEIEDTPAQQINDPYAAMGMQSRQAQPQPAVDADPLPF